MFHTQNYLQRPEYCNYAYHKANINIGPNDVDFFLPFEVLRTLLQNPETASIYSGYEDYIQNSI